MLILLTGYNKMQLETISDFKDDLIEKLRTILDQKGLSPEEAAGFIGVSYRSIYRWLKYEYRPLKQHRKAIKLGIARISRLK